METGKGGGSGSKRHSTMSSKAVKQWKPCWNAVQTGPCNKAHKGETPDSVGTSLT